MVTGSAADLPPGGARAVARCDALAVPPYSDTSGGLFRAYLTPAHRAALDALAAWMKTSGMAVRLDPAANLVGRYEGVAPGAPALLIGSHIDSVRDAGRYDGPLGILLGIELVAALAAAGRRLPFAIEVIAFGDEEGSRFPASMLGSRAVAGTLDLAALETQDAAGITLAAALAKFGLDRDRFAEAAHLPGSVLAFVEPHIEQGPVLEVDGLALATVTGIAGQLRHRATVTGWAGHAGTTAMGLRRDALAAAAEMVLAVEHAALAAGGDVVATVGRMQVVPRPVNVIAGEAAFSMDVRSGDMAARDAAAGAIRTAVTAIAARRGVTVAIEQVQDLPASPCDPRLMDLMDRALTACGQPPRRLVSGAGHDTMVMAALCPTAMLFIRCAGGISHNPAERVDPADAQAALAVLLAFVDLMEKDHIA